MSVETPWPICAACRAIPRELFCRSEDLSDTDALPSHFLHGSFLAFRQSAFKGCHVCTLLYEAVREPFKSRLQTAPIYLESTVTHGEARSVAVTADLHQSRRSGGDGELALSELTMQDEDQVFENTAIADVKFCFRPGDISPAARNYKGLLSMYPHDPGGVQYVRQLLDRCLKHHGYSCDMVIMPHSATTTQEFDPIDIVYGKNGLTKAPTRLVDVGSDDPAEPARLVAGTDCLRHDTPGYLALSYCNGETPKPAPWQMTSSTKSAFEDEIPFDILPQTLYDAIMWTRRLGLRFIWIDNLCIIQDSKEDWQREASMMASIYGSAILTLCAASGSIYGGMTGRQNPLRSSAAAVSLHRAIDSEKEEFVYILPQGQKAAVELPAPTISRAWCFQEDVLSPRIVRFTTSQIDWQCLSDKSPVERRQCLENLRTHEPHRWYTLWYRLIEQYSKKQLSYAADKMTAVSGIAASKSCGGTYLAGVWKEDIWAGLLWSRDITMYTTDPGQRYHLYIAPTWSWAALDVPVAFHAAVTRSRRKCELPLTNHDPQLHSADIELSTFNTVGDVRGGSIVLTATSMAGLTTSVDPDLFVRNPQTHSAAQGCRRFRLALKRDVVGEIIFDVAAEAKDNLWLYCILLQVTELEVWARTGIAGIGLALRLHRDQRGGAVYKRVGYARYTCAYAGISQRRRFTMV